FFYSSGYHRYLHSFPTRRSSDLYSTALSGKNVRNSLHSCAASVLLWAITSAGRCTCSITPAIVNVLPVPVAPSRVWKRAPRRTPSASASIAAGWSAVGVNTESSLKAGMRPPTVASAPLHATRRAAARNLAEAQLAAVGDAVVELDAEHVLDVFARLREWDRSVTQRLPVRARVGHPAVDVGEACVVGGDREHLVSGVVVEQVSEVVAAVRHVH